MESNHGGSSKIGFKHFLWAYIIKQDTLHPMLITALFTSSQGKKLPANVHQHNE